MSVPKLVVGCGPEEIHRNRIERLLRSHCHVDTLSNDKVRVVAIQRPQQGAIHSPNVWATLPEDSDILLHPSVPQGLRNYLLRSNKPGYGAITECRELDQFERRLQSRLKSLSLYWSDSVVELLRHWSHDDGIDVGRVLAWSNQFGSHLGGAILRSLAIIRANQLLGMTGVSDFDCFDEIVAITDEQGQHAGSEGMLKGLLEKRNRELLSLETVASKSEVPRRILILADWLLSGRQFLSYLSRSKDSLRKLAGAGSRFCLAAARITELARGRVEQAVRLLEIEGFKIQQPLEGFLPNLRGDFEEPLDPETFMPLEAIGEGQIVTEFEMRLKQTKQSDEQIERWLHECAALGYELLYPVTSGANGSRSACWGLGDHALGLTTLSCTTQPPGLLPVLWAKGPVNLNGRRKDWVPLITQR